VKQVEIYTDGSALKAHEGKFYCGCGVVLIYGDIIKEVSHSCGYATVNIAELTAPLLGLKLLKEPCKVRIYSDSQYTINSITKWYLGWVKNKWRNSKKEEVKNKELIQELYNLCQQHEVTWVKVKGHSGNYYNELADQLAVAASNKFKEGELNEC
jgi:ribonuclease HI